MNHCPVSSDERRHSHQQGMEEARQDYIDTKAGEYTDSLDTALLSAQTQSKQHGRYSLTFSKDALALLQLILTELPEEVFGLARELVKQDMENSDES